MDQLKNSSQETRLHFLDYWRIIRIRKTVILAVFLLVVITATVVTLMIPEMYAGKARIQVEQDRPDINVNGIQGNIGSGYDAYFLLTEFQTIQSQPVLSLVSEKMDLRNVWGKKYNNGQPMSESDVEQMIKSRLDLQNVRNTKFIEIKAFSDNAEEAARLANQVAESYRDYRSAEYEELKHGGIHSLTKQLQDQDQKIVTLQSNVDYLRTSLNIPDA
ncbi:MAG TPA: Wzz/FepE/Etk N-terminal domain-containing protein, partial [Terriglobia bacterium]|nr:Wzz/FepE/Etk N-terminal domain-containing protein [Terriglobia bacterium]